LRFCCRSGTRAQLNRLLTIERIIPNEDSSSWLSLFLACRFIGLYLNSQFHKGPWSQQHHQVKIFCDLATNAIIHLFNTTITFCVLIQLSFPLAVWTALTSRPARQPFPFSRAFSPSALSSFGPTTGIDENVLLSLRSWDVSLSVGQSVEEEIPSNAAFTPPEKAKNVWFTSIVTYWEFDASHPIWYNTWIHSLLFAGVSDPQAGSEILVWALKNHKTTRDWIQRSRGNSWWCFLRCESFGSVCEC
jgi:hypothetical protein